MALAASTAFVTVIEPHAALEPQVLLLAESLRRWGGRLADAPIVCVSPRFHLPIDRAVLARFNELGIVYIDHNLGHRLSWYGFLNKALAIAEARRAVDTENLVWLDADTLILDEPDAFLDGKSDFAAMFAGGDISTSGPADPLDAYWAAACDRLGLDLDALPWIEADGRRVRYCIQAGVFRVRRESRVCDGYLANFEALMDSRLVPSTHGLFYHETMALALAPFTCGASWEELPRSHNFIVTSGEDNLVEGLRSARVCHYHAWLYPERRGELLRALGRSRPDRLEWLQSRIPSLDASRTSPMARVLRRGLAWVRRQRAQRFLASCRKLNTGPPRGNALGR